MSTTMNQLVQQFPDQLREAMQIAANFALPTHDEYDQVLICGLGGSGIGGTILAQLIAGDCPVPVSSSKDYSIPAFVDHRTLVIACSYSGNTEETLEALETAIDKKAQIACITSGGKLLEMATKHGWPCIKIPGGYPPRAAFGFSLVQLLRLASLYGMTRLPWETQMSLAIDHISGDQERISRAGNQLAEGLQHKLPIIYTSSWLNGVATRWRQQINENAKMLSWADYYPEQNHNELVGWRSENHNLAVVFLTSNHDHDRVAKRMELTSEVYRKYTPHVHHIAAEGDTMLEQAIYLIHLGDWMSVHLADLRGADSIEVHVIDWLKGELGRF